jgi:cytochrome c oxidase subunit 5b
LDWGYRKETDGYTEIKNEQDLIGPGAAIGTVPSDLEQATGLERLEILGKMQGVDIFDMKPLDASRKGRTRHAISDAQEKKAD